MIHTRGKSVRALCGLVAAISVCSLLPSWMPSVDAAPVPKPIKDRGRIWLLDHDAKRLIAYSPEGELIHRLSLPEEQQFFGVTPDGSKILYAATSGDKQTYHLRDLGHHTAGVNLGIDYSQYDYWPLWNRDGTKFIRRRGSRPVGLESVAPTHDVFDIKTKSVTRIDSPFHHWVLGWATTENYFLTWCHGSDGNRNGTLSLITGKGELFPLEQVGDQVSPGRILPAADRRTLLMSGIKQTPKSEPWYQGLWKMDVFTGQVTELIHEKGHGHTEAHWSLDCSELCMFWCYFKDPNSSDGWDELRLTIAKADGSNRQTRTLRDKSKGEKTSGLSLLGWYPSNHTIRAAK